jgi:hypothetical protein
LRLEALCIERLMQKEKPEGNEVDPVNLEWRLEQGAP